MEGDHYWNSRANLLYLYKNEVFYTITPIPYYYQRREVILQNIRRYLKKVPNKKICDFGCGDGIYIKKLFLDGFNFHGVDISQEMVNLAKNNNDSSYVSFEVSGSGIQEFSDFGLVYSSAIFAHIDDSNMFTLFKNIYNNLCKGGYFIICEQVAPYRYQGKTYVRRTTNEYIQDLERAGFTLEEVFIIDFWLHRIFFERFIQKIFVKLSYNKNNVLIRLNKNCFYKLFSWIFATFSIPRIFFDKNKWGYSFIVVKKI